MTTPMPIPAAGNVSSHPWMPGFQIRKGGAGLHASLGIPQGARLSIAALAKAMPSPSAIKRRKAIFGAEAKRRMAMAGGGRPPVAGI